MADRFKYAEFTSGDVLYLKREQPRNGMPHRRDHIHIDMRLHGVPFCPLVMKSRWPATPVNADGEHLHPGCIEILYCLRGYDSRFFCNGESYPLRPGDIALAFSQDRHGFLNPGSGAANYSMLIQESSRRTRQCKTQPGENGWLVDRLLKVDKKVFQGNRAIADGFRRIMARIGDSAESSPLDRIRNRLDVLNILVEVLDCALGVSSAGRTPSVETIIADMRSHPEREYLVDEICRRIGVTCPTLMSLFKRQTGVPPHAFHIRCRMERAKELLSGHGMSVVAAAMAVGYRSAERFSRQFKSIVGCTPRDWRSR